MKETKGVVIKVEDEDKGDEGRKHWADSEVKALIVLHGEWNPNL